MTIHNIAANLKKTKGGEGAILNLEKEFRNKFKGISKFAETKLLINLNPKSLQKITLF